MLGCRFNKNLQRIYSASGRVFSILHAVGEIYEDRGKNQKQKGFKSVLDSAG